MHPDREIFHICIWSDGLSILTNEPNTLTRQSFNTNNAPWEPTLRTHYMES